MDIAKEIQMIDVQSNNPMEEDSSDGDDETWDEVDPETESQIVCLFCPQIFKTMVVALEHCKIVHHFNLMDIKVKFNMNCYSYISMINYIRREAVVPELVTSSTEAPWLNETYLTPVLQDDPWLMFDFDGLESDNEMDSSNQLVLNPVNFSNVKAENGIVTLPESCFNQLQQTLKFYGEELQKKDSMLSAAMDQINDMRNVAAKIVCCDLTNEEKELENKILTMNLSEDNGYFRTYSHFGIHHEMLSDEIRMSSFRNAIIQNSAIFANKIILDVGCGSGILSMFAASANADKVFGVDQSEIIYHANDIVRENDLSSKIDLIHGKVEEITLLVEKVDIIISEWLGYFLLFEGMLDSVLYARDKYLKPDGHILPNRCCLYLTGLSDLESYKKMISFWSDVYGYKMSSLAKEVLQEAMVKDVPPETVVTSSAAVFDLNLYVHKINETDFTSEFTLESHTDGQLTALCGYFDVIFNLPHEVSFSTSPNSPKTHWKQTVFYLPQPINIQQGMLIRGQINCKRKSDDRRSLIISIDILDQKNRYILA